MSSQLIKHRVIVRKISPVFMFSKAGRPTFGRWQVYTTAQTDHQIFSTKAKAIAFAQLVRRLDGDFTAAISASFHS